jgi:hypothetical protein
VDTSGAGKDWNFFDLDDALLIKEIQPNKKIWMKA